VELAKCVKNFLFGMNCQLLRLVLGQFLKSVVFNVLAILFKSVIYFSFLSMRLVTLIFEHFL